MKTRRPKSTPRSASLRVLATLGLSLACPLAALADGPLSNPTFADADGNGIPKNWNAFPPADGSTRILAPAPGGGLTFKDNDKNTGLGIEQWVPVQEGQNYTATADVEGTGNLTLMLIFAKEKPARASDLKAVQVGDKSVKVEAGKPGTLSAVAPAGAKWMKFWLYCPKIGVTDVVIKKVSLTESAPDANSTEAKPATAPQSGEITVLDFETGDLSQAHQGKGEGANVSVIKKGEGPVREGEYAAKTALSKSKVRAEVPGHRSDAYGIARYGWSMFIPQDFDAFTHFSIVTQWHSWGTGKESPKDGGPPTCLVIHKGEIKLKLLAQGDDGWTSKKTEFPLGSIEDMRGKWTDWVLEINWQPPGKDGWLKLYKNDKLVLDYKGTTWYEEKDKGPYFKFGLYKGAGQWKGEEPGAILYFDSARMALGANSTYKMVAPSAYSPRPQ